MLEKTILDAIWKYAENKKTNVLKNLLQRKCPRIYQWILDQTHFLDKYDVIKGNKHSLSILERLYCIAHGLKDRPLCQKCHKNHVCSFDKQKMEYRKWCSPRCQASDPSCIASSKATRKSKFGDENYVGVDKARETRYKNNDGKWHADDFQKKCNATNVANGHNPGWNNAEKAAETLKQHLEEDQDFWSKREQKSKATKVANGKDPNWNNREKFKITINNRSEEQKKDTLEKRKNTNRRQTGYDFPIQNPRIKTQIEKKLLDDYGVTCSLNIPEVRSKSIRRKKEMAWNRIQSDIENYIPLFTKEEFLANKDHNHQWNWKCGRCGNVFSSRWADGHHTVCRNCYPRKQCASISNEEKEISEFLKALCKDEIVMTSNRELIKPLELDILIPSRNIAVEFDGMYWHSEENKPQNYHLNKTNLCEAKGIQLVHIFENEWLYKRRIVESRLKNLLGIYDQIVFARKCEVREVRPSDSMDFQEENHIQGAIGAKVHLGLYFNNEIVALMTFGKSRFNKKAEWELLRFCNKLGYHIPGAAGKLLRHFEKNWHPKSLISYADRRWSQGKLYKALGFKLDHISKPDYWYIDTTSDFWTLQSRFHFQKHKLPKILKKFDPNLSEVENMLANNYRRIFDCGNLVFMKTY